MSKSIYYLGVWYADESFIAIIERAHSGRYIVLYKNYVNRKADLVAKYFPDLSFARLFMETVFLGVEKIRRVNCVSEVTL